MRLVEPLKLSQLQTNVENVRNICILAHVDHGKTTLADSLVASNGIISQRSVGSLRYLDSRPDEQQRGITMKSSSISLLHNWNSQEYLVNLIDSPGHVDFSSEVSTAVRLCDGAIIVVDVVEGVCPQTRIALKQAYSENIKPVLVLNKIDRLILEMQLNPLDAYVHITQVLEQVNAVLGELFTSEIFEKDDETAEIKKENPSDKKEHFENQSTFEYTLALEEADDSHLYFSPESGNVVFASAIDGWGFSVSTFSKIFSEKLGIKEELLKKVLWGDFYLDSKSKRFMKGAQEKAKKPLFVQLVLENLWSLYDTIAIRKDKEKLETMVTKLGIKLTSRDLKHRDSKVQLQAVLSQWLPLALVTLDMVCSKLPSPKDITESKVEKLMCSHTRLFDSLLPETKALKKNFLECSSEASAPVIVFISKMFPVERKNMPENRAKPLTAEEIALRREIARQRILDKQNQQTETPSEEQNITQVEPVKEAVEELDDDVFIGFARVFSGILKKGCKLLVLGPKHDPALLPKTENIEIDENLTLKDLRSSQHMTVAEIKQLYLLMGRELENLDEVPAGNIVGIGGLDDHVLKTATLSTTHYCPSFSEMQMFSVPIVRVAVETKHPSDMPKLVKGLKLLNQADASVQVLVQETGEHVLLTAGEVHLERCLEDLSSRYAKVPINVSEPIVPFRETIVPPPKMDMVNEEIDSQNIQSAKQENSAKDEVEKTIVMQTINKQCTIKITAIPLPQKVTLLLEANSELLKMLDKRLSSLIPQQNVLENELSKLSLADSELFTKDVDMFKQNLENAFKTCEEYDWSNAVNEIMCAGPRKCGPNLLMNRVSDFKRSLFNLDVSNEKDMRSEFISSFINGFQLATLAGPICEEPIMGVAFLVEEWTMIPNEEMGSAAAQSYGTLSGQIMSAVKEGCRKAFQAQPQRLMAAMYTCHINAKAQVLGSMYGVIRRRHGKLLSEEADRLSSSFTVTAALPVIESFRLADELRKQTTGLASLQLNFSHWEIIEIDPFWTPSTESEYIHFGEKADSLNRAKKYMDAVRRRKGLHVDDKIVQFAEKQRTLSKNK